MCVWVHNAWRVFPRCVRNMVPGTFTIFASQMSQPAFYLKQPQQRTPVHIESGCYESTLLLLFLAIPNNHENLGLDPTRKSGKVIWKKFKGKKAGCTERCGHLRVRLIGCDLLWTMQHHLHRLCQYLPEWKILFGSRRRTAKETSQRQQCLTESSIYLHY